MGDNSKIAEFEISLPLVNEITSILKQPLVNLKKANY